MTISTANTAELTVNQIIRQALVSVGMMPLEAPMSGGQWNARAAVGRERLQVILGGLQSKQFLLRSVENYTRTIVSGDGAAATPISLPADTLDVIGPAMWTDSGETSESILTQIDREQWHTYSDKATTGRPSMFYVEKLGTVKIYLLQPAGASEAGARLRLQRQKLLANMIGNTGQTPDLERSWAPFLIAKLAEFFASGTLPIQAAQARAAARDAYADALPAATGRLPQRITFRGWTQ